MKRATVKRRTIWLMALLLAGWLLSQAALLPGRAATTSEIQARGRLIVAVKDNLPPLGFLQNGELAGLEIDLARQLAIDLLGDEAEVAFVPVRNDRRLATLLAGEVDLVIARMTATDARARLVDFSSPYYFDGTTFVTQDLAIERLANLGNQPIAVLNGSSTIATVRSLLPSALLVGASSYQEALTLLESNRAVAFAADASALTGWVQEFPQYRRLDPLISAEALSVAMPKGNRYSDLRSQVNASIDRLRETGWLADRLEIWGLPE